MSGKTRLLFIEREDGGTTIEFVLWVPILVFILALTVDTSMTFARQSHMWRVATEISRSLSTGSLRASEVAQRAASMSQGRSVYAVTVTQTGNLVTTTVSVPLRSSAFMGVLGRFGDHPVVASVTMELQPHVQSIN